jgi:opacity protein-like surface antigen
VPITLSLKPALQFAPFELYGLVGGGLYIINVETREFSGRTGSFSFSDSDSVFGAHVGGGFNWNINPRVAVGLELKYIWAEKKFEKTVNNTKFEVDADLQGLQTTLNLSFRF